MSELLMQLPGGFEMLVILAILAIPLAIWVMILFDIGRSRFEGNQKVLWFLAVLIFNIPAAIIYLIIGRTQKIES